MTSHERIISSRAKSVKADYYLYHKRLKNYEEILIDLLKGNRGYIPPSDIIYAETELFNTSMLLDLLETLIDFDFENKPHDQIYREYLGMSQQKVWVVLNNGIRLNKYEMIKIHSFIKQNKKRSEE